MASPLSAASIQALHAALENSDPAEVGAALAWMALHPASALALGHHEGHDALDL